MMPVSAIDRNEGVEEERRRGIVFLAAARTARSIAAGMINIAFPYYILVELHHGATVIGLIYVAATVSTAILSFLFGVTTDTWGKRKTLLITSILLPVSALMVYFSPSLWVIVLAAMLGGYSATGSLAGGGVGGAVQPVQNAVLTDLTPKEKRTAYFSYFTFLAGASGALGALLAGTFNVHDLFLIAAIIAVAGIPALWFVKITETKGTVRRLKAKKTIGEFSMTGMLNGFAQGLIIPFLVPFFLLVYHLPKAQMAEYAFLSGLIGSFALLTAPLLEKNLGFVKSMIVTRGIGTVLFVLFPIIRFLPFSILVYIIAPALRVAAVPVQQAELTRRVNADEIGRALSINQVARLAASSAGTMLGGYLIDAAFIDILFFAYGLVMVANLYLYIRFFGARSE